MDAKVSLAKCDSYEACDIEPALDALFAQLDALNWVKPGMRIAVKANLVMGLAPERAATPHPALVRGLCTRLIALGADVVLGDSPGGLYSKAYLDPIYKATGMTAVSECGARLNYDFGEREVKVEGGKALRSFWCCEYLLRADAIIDLCKLKTHALMGYTGACKNLFGGMTGMHKAESHYKFPTHESFAAMLVDLCEFFRPKLSICDGILAMEGNGPSFGEPRHMGVLLASFNPHALDLAAARIIGLEPAGVPTLAEAVSRALIPDSADKLDIIGGLEQFCVKDFKLQPLVDIRYWGVRNASFSKLMKRMLVSRPKPGQSCIGCGKCAGLCPAKAITLAGKRPQIDRSKCICCFCCAEFCPQGAMEVYEPFLSRLLNKK